MSQALTVTPATPDDADAVASVLLRAFAEFEPLYTAEAFSATTPTATQIRARFHEGPVWLAAHGGELVGTVAAVMKGNGVYIRSMAVLPAARGQGAGQALLRAAEQFARAARAERLFLSTTPFLHSAIKLYERSGFRRTTEGPHQLFGTPLFTMVKPLAGNAPPAARN